MSQQHEDTPPISLSRADAKWKSALRYDDEATFQIVFENHEPRVGGHAWAGRGWRGWRGFPDPTLCCLKEGDFTQRKSLFGCWCFFVSFLQSLSCVVLFWFSHLFRIFF